MYKEKVDCSIEVRIGNTSVRDPCRETCSFKKKKGHKQENNCEHETMVQFYMTV